MYEPTFKLVELCVKPPREYRSIRTVREAIQALLQHWPYEEQLSQPYVRACQACLDAMENDGSPEKARWAFIGAAKAAELKIRSEPTLEPEVFLHEAAVTGLGIQSPEQGQVRGPPNSASSYSVPQILTDATQNQRPHREE